MLASVLALGACGSSDPDSQPDASSVSPTDAADPGPDFVGADLAWTDMSFTCPDPGNHQAGAITVGWQMPGAGSPQPGHYSPRPDIDPNAFFPSKWGVTPVCGCERVTRRLGIPSDRVPPEYYSAGTIRVAGQRSVTMHFDQGTGYYTVDQDQAGLPPLFTPGSLLTVDSGGDTVPRISVRLRGPTPMIVLAPPSEAALSWRQWRLGGSELRVSWTGADQLVYASLIGPGNESEEEIICLWNAKEGTGTIPAALLNAIVGVDLFFRLKVFSIALVNVDTASWTITVSAGSTASDPAGRPYSAMFSQ